MPSPEVEEFATLLMHRVRDAAIRVSDRTLQENHAVAKRWRAAMEESGEATASVMIPDCVDETIYNLLRAIDEGALQVRFVASSGEVVDLSEEGKSELAGWFMGSEGWRRQFSQERFVDDFADLELDLD
jgi:acyl-CoA reductase-like NAD-dependent aldehyde dehydrogenase